MVIVDRLDKIRLNDNSVYASLNYALSRGSKTTASLSIARFIVLVVFVERVRYVFARAVML